MPSGVQHLPAAVVSHFDVPLIAQIVQRSLERVAVFGNIDGFHVFVVHAKCDGFQPVKVDSKGKVFKLLSFFQLLQKFSRLFCHIFTSFCLNYSRIAGETQVALREGCNMFDIPKLMQVLSEILSDKYGCTIIMTAIPKDQADTKVHENAPEPCGE